MATALLLGFGALIGLWLEPTLAYHMSADPEAVWEAGGATALLLARSSESWYACPLPPGLLIRVARRKGRGTGGEYSVHLQSWPAFDPRALVVEHVTLVIQVDGKTRARIQVPAGLDQEQVLERAKGRENVRRHVMDREPRNVIFVSDRLINFVTDARDPSA